MNAPTHPIEQLHAELGDLDWVTDEGRIARLSQDFNWYSPVLKRQLESKRAAAAVRPRTEEEIRRVVSLCAKLRVPITIRGSGTGNYGQSVPLEGGVIIDMSGYAAFLWARDGVGRAQAGIRLWNLEKELQPHGLELRCMPSTWRSATLGGLYGGGFGGVGSINYGPLAARGDRHPQARAQAHQAADLVLAARTHDRGGLLVGQLLDVVGHRLGQEGEFLLDDAGRAGQRIAEIQRSVEGVEHHDVLQPVVDRRQGHFQFQHQAVRAPDVVHGQCFGAAQLDDLRLFRDGHRADAHDVAAR